MKFVGQKHAYGGGMYLPVKAAGKYWRLDYRPGDKRNEQKDVVYDFLLTSESYGHPSLPAAANADVLHGCYCFDS